MEQEVASQWLQEASRCRWRRQQTLETGEVEEDQQAVDDDGTVQQPVAVIDSHQKNPELYLDGPEMIQRAGQDKRQRSTSEVGAGDKSMKKKKDGFAIKSVKYIRSADWKLGLDRS